MRVLLYLAPVILSWGFMWKPRQPPKYTRLDATNLDMWDVLSTALKEKARNWFISRAEKSGVKWTAITGSYTKEMELLTNEAADKDA